MSLEKRNLIVLTHFTGHDAIGDDEMNTFRYEHLKDIVFNPFGLKFVIISNHATGDRRMREILAMSNVENIHCWIKVQEDHGDNITREEVELLVAERGYEIDKVFVGGANTAGCVLTGKGWSALTWAKAGYDTSIILGLCGEYQMSGTSYDRSLKAFHWMYEMIRRENLVHKINVEYKLNSTNARGSNT